MSRVRFLHSSVPSTAYRIPWAKEHLEDHYVKLAHKDGYRCRSAYKLIELQSKFRILKPNISVVDLGASPGSWSQVAADIVFKSADQNEGVLIAVDIQTIAPIDNVTILNGLDITRESTRDKIKSLIPIGADVVMSDMAPSPSGIKDIDNYKIIELCRSGMSLAVELLVAGGTFLCKVWHSGLSDNLQRDLSQHFAKTQLVTTKATKKGSKEKYIVCRGFKGKY